MTGLALAALGLFGMFVFAALGDLVSEEIRGWLDLAPRAILRLAAIRLDPELRESIYQEEWLPELIYVLRGAESRPITRLIRGATFALGLLVSAGHIARYRTPASVTAPEVIEVIRLTAEAVRINEIQMREGSDEVVVEMTGPEGPYRVIGQVKHWSGPLPGNDGN